MDAAGFTLCHRLAVVAYICGESPSQIEEDTHKSQTMLACIAGNIDYNMLHQWLGTTGHVARPLHQRRAHLMDLLEEAEE